MRVGCDVEEVGRQLGAGFAEGLGVLRVAWFCW